MNPIASIDEWIAPVMIIIALVLLIGNFSTVQKSAKTPLRKKSLNDLKETLPRTHKTDHKLPVVGKSNASGNFSESHISESTLPSKNSTTASPATTKNKSE